MKYDKKVNLLSTNNVSDGMGGWIESGTQVIATIDTFITPVKADVLLKEYGITSTTTFKIFTKAPLNIRENGKLKDIIFNVVETGEEFRVVQFADFGKVRMLLVEVVK